MDIEQLAGLESCAIVEWMEVVAALSLELILSWILSDREMSCLACWDLHKYTSDLPSDTDDNMDVLHHISHVFDDT